MQLQGQLCYLLSLGAFLTLLSHSTANVLRDENSLNSLYNNLLQREYAGPIVFPNHQVERKAQRSPSLRLRFGRRSDPDLLPQVFEKRWFGDVNQKPIRSPSLRLRFGRRSDPSMPMHSPFDILMNGQQTDEINNDDYNDLYGGLYDRVIRKAQRLRFGRSQPFSSLANTNENNLETNDNESDDINEVPLLSEDALNEFERAIRSVPLRLRWGRSTGGRNAQLNTEEQTKNDLEQKYQNKESITTAAVPLLENDIDEVKRAKRSIQEQKDNEVVKTSSTSHLEAYKVQVKRARRDIPVRLHFGHGTDGRRAELNSEELPKYDLEQKKKVTELTNDVDNTDSHQNQD